LKYEFDLFFRIINSDLLPESNEVVDIKSHISFLQGRFEQCIKHYKIQFKQNLSGGYLVQQVDEYAFLDLAGMLYKGTSPENDALLPDEIITQSLSVISVDREQITGTRYTNNKKELSLEITARLEFSHLQPHEARFHYYRTLAHDEVERIKHSFHQQCFSLQSQDQIELFIQNHQLELETLTRSLLNHLDEPERKNLYSLSGKYTIPDIYKTTYHYLEKVQRHIERYFTKYLAIDASIPYKSRLLNSVDIDKKLKVVYERLMESSLDEKLLKIINYLLSKLAQVTPGERFTYQALIYHTMVLDELYTAIQREERILNNDLLAEILYRLNFNSIDFFYYLTTSMENTLSAQDSYADKKDILYFYQKMYRQRPVKTNVFYQKSLLSIKEQVLHWLQEEIYYLEKIGEIKQAKDKKADNTQQGKITTQFSVSQLAYILKIMHETGLITVKSQWDMFRFMQENVGSKRKETISAQSLNNKYYSVEAATKTSVKDLLLKLLNHINKAK
jgi:hypothetical protein